MDLEGEEHLFLKKLTGTDDFESVFTSLTLTGDLTVEGLTNLQDTLDMGSAQIKGMANATASDDALTLGQMNTELGNYVKLNGTSAMAGALNLDENNIRKLNQLKGTNDIERFRCNTAGEVTMNSNLSFNGEFIVNPRTETVPDADSSGTRIPQTEWVQDNFLRFTQADALNNNREHVVDNLTKRLFISRNESVDFDLHFNLMADSTKSSNFGLLVGGTKNSDTGYRFKAASGALQLQVRDSGSTTFANALRVKSSNGFVGININPPTAQLHVDGQIKSSYNPMAFVSCFYDHSATTAYGKNLGTFTRSGTGQYTINFSITTSVPYVALASVQRSTTDYVITVFSIAATFAKIVIKETGGTHRDNDFSFVAIEV